MPPARTSAPCRSAFLNLMPNKIRTETQIARLLGASPAADRTVALMRIGGHTPKNTSAGHLISFYQTWEEVAERKFDGFLVTGAPVEQLDFEEVTYWDELAQYLRLDTDECAFEPVHLLGGDGGSLAFSRAAEIPARKESLRGLPPAEPRPGFALSQRLLG